MTVDEALARMTANAPSISEIWFYGSRVNGTARSASDMDVLIFGDATALAALREAGAPACETAIDAMLTIDGDECVQVWPEGNVQKRYWLSEGWNWRRVSSSEAVYTGMRDGRQVWLRAVRWTG